MSSYTATGPADSLLLDQNSQSGNESSSRSESGSPSLPPVDQLDSLTLGSAAPATPSPASSTGVDTPSQLTIDEAPLDQIVNDPVISVVPSAPGTPHSQHDSSPIPYSVLDEPTPEHEFFSQEFQQALQSGLGIAKDTVDAIQIFEAIAELDVNGSRILEETKICSEFRVSASRKVAVLGDSGEGKK